VAQDNPWIDYDLWVSVQDTFDMAEVSGYPCWLSFDLSERIDLTAAAAVWKRPKDGRLFARTWFWTPLGNLAERERQDESNYGLWIKDGHGFAPPGRIISVAAVAEWLIGFSAENKVQGIAYDRWKFETLLDELEKEGIKYHTWAGPGVPIEGRTTGFCLMKHGQGFSDGAEKPDMLWMPGSVNALESAIATGNISIYENPALTKATSYAVLKSDGTGNRKFEKGVNRASKARIDPLLALCMAVGAAEITPTTKKKSFWQ